MDLTTLCVLILVAFVKNHTRYTRTRMEAVGTLMTEPRNPPAAVLAEPAV